MIFTTNNTIYFSILANVYLKPFQRFSHYLFRGERESETHARTHIEGTQEEEICTQNLHERQQNRNVI